MASAEFLANPPAPVARRKAPLAVTLPNQALRQAQDERVYPAHGEPVEPRPYQEKEICPAGLTPPTKGLPTARRRSVKG